MNLKVRSSHQIPRLSSLMQGEETVKFPQWGKAAVLVSPMFYRRHHPQEPCALLTGVPQDIWTRNVERHHTFATQLDATWLYLRQCRSNHTPTPPSSVAVPPPDIANLDVTVY